MLAEIVAQPLGERTVIPLAFHVDYWNYIGWTDPFSSADWSARQRRADPARRNSKAGQPVPPGLAIALAPSRPLKRPAA